MSNGSGLDNPDRKVTSPVADISTAPASKRIISHGVRSLKDKEEEKWVKHERLNQTTVAISFKSNRFKRHRNRNQRQCVIMCRGE